MKRIGEIIPIKFDEDGELSFMLLVGVKFDASTPVLFCGVALVGVVGKTFDGVVGWSFCCNDCCSNRVVG